MDTVDIYGDEATVKMYAEGTLEELVDSFISRVGTTAFNEYDAIKSVALYNARQVEYSAFIYCRNLTTFVAPLVSSIGQSAFIGCNKLRHVAIPNIKTIGMYAFSDTFLEELNFPKLTTLNNSAFAACYLLGRARLDELKEIPGSVFMNCVTLSEVFAPSASNIGMQTFYRCVLLSSIAFENVKTVASNAFQLCYALCDVSLPKLQSIGSFAFKDCCLLKSLSFSQLTQIGDGAFTSDACLQTVDFPILTSLNQTIFTFCHNLDSVSIPSVKAIGSSAFSQCYNLRNISLPLVSIIYNNAFAGCYNLRSVVFESTSVVTLSASNIFSFTGPYLRIFVPDSMVNDYKTAQNWSFISSRIFGVSEYSIAQVEKTITDATGMHSGDTEVVLLSDTVITYIGDGSFAKCRCLSEIFLPSVVTINPKAFSDCTGLNTVNLPNVTAIGNGAFSYCVALKSVSIPNAVSISEYAFYYNVALSNIDMPSVSYIGGSAFSYCYMLKNISAPLLKMVGHAFMQSNNRMESVYFPVLSSVGTYCFNQCYQLKTASLPEIEKAGNSCFAYCYQIEEWSLPKLSEIGSYAFVGCYNLKTANIPAIKYIPYAGFNQCFNLETVILSGSSVVEGASSMFNRADSVKFFVPDSLVTAYQSAVYWSMYSSRIFGHSRLPESISAVFTQGQTVVFDTDSIESLKSMLVITATYANSSSEVVPSTDYKLSGTLSVGTSVIKVSYGGKTSTFSVAVTEDYKAYECYYDFTESLTDKSGHTTLALSHGSEANTDAQRSSSGLVFSQPAQVAHFGQIDPVGKTFEFTIDSFTFSGDTSKHIRLLMCSNDSHGIGPLIYRANTGYNAYAYTREMTNDSTKGWSGTKWSGMQGSGASVINMISGKTIKIVFEDKRTVSLYINNVLQGRITDLFFNSDSQASAGSGGRYTKSISFGGIIDTPTVSEGDQCYNLTLRNFKVYSN